MFLAQLDYSRTRANHVLDLISMRQARESLIGNWINSGKVSVHEMRYD